jgi:hypothetical protein
MGEIHTILWLGDLKGRELVTLWPKRKGDIRMDLTEIGWGTVDWMHLAEDGEHWWGVVNTVMNLPVS